MATQALTFLLGIGDTLAGKLLTFDALALSFRTFTLKKNAACAACGDVRTVTELVDYERFCGGSCSGSAASERTDDMKEITPVELKAKQDAGEKFLLIDVREPWEYDLARIPGAILVPLGEIERRAHEFDDDAEIILSCKMGSRSAQALAVLQSKGFTNLANLKGGIFAWTDTVDPATPKY